MSSNYFSVRSFLAFIVYSIFFLFSNLDHDFLLVKGELQVPFGLVSGNVSYKYVVLRMGREKGEEGKYLWERIVHAGPYKNRCLCIPKNRCHIGGTCRAQ